MDLANVLYMLAGLYDAEPSKAEAGNTTQWQVVDWLCFSHLIQPPSYNRLYSGNFLSIRFVFKHIFLMIKNFAQKIL